MKSQRVEMLIATMNQPLDNYSLLEKMNIQSDAIVCNQCDRFFFKEFTWKGNSIKWFDFNEKGVGLNRNNALMRATGDIIVFCDDDMVYVDGYPRMLIEGFDKNQQSDVLIFNIEGRPQNTASNVVTRLNYLRYGAARIAAKREMIKNNGILFNLCFGGGTEHQHGEDNIFLCDCLNKGLRISTYPILIAKLTDERPSTWRKDFGEKYFKDQGALYKQISRHNWKLLCLLDAIKHSKNRYKCSWSKAYKLMTTPEEKGIENQYKNRR